MTTTTMTAMPQNAAAPETARVLLEVNDIKKHFPLRGGVLNRRIGSVQAVDGVSFEVRRGETLGIVGESGCGKSTTARLLMRLMEPDSGDVILGGEKVGRGNLPLRDMRRRMQMVFQDSYASLNPRLTVEDTIAFGAIVHGVPQAEARRRARDLLSRVGLEPNVERRWGG